MTALRPRRTVRLLTFTLGALLAVAACTSGSGATAAPSTAPAAVALPATPAAAAAGSVNPASSAAAQGRYGNSAPPEPTSAASGNLAGSTYTVAVANASGIGKFLTGVDGKSLYTLKSDSTDTTTCSGACATNWPPFTLGAGATTVAGSGVTGKLGTFTRPEGTTQVTYAGMPLYYFAGDSKAGDTNGQGLKGVWFVASPDAKASGGATY
jgi:predicted lipoprotein with Yx(FWY)xxD motif